MIGEECAMALVYGRLAAVKHRTVALFGQTSRLTARRKAMPGVGGTVLAEERGGVDPFQCPRLLAWSLFSLFSCLVGLSILSPNLFCALLFEVPNRLEI